MRSSFVCSTSFGFIIRCTGFTTKKKIAAAVITNETRAVMKAP